MKHRVQAFWQAWGWLIVAGAMGLVAAAPLWGAGMVNTRGGGDSPFLLQRTMDMAYSLRSGEFPVRWMAHAAYDLGYPFFNYYASLPYYLSGGLTSLGLSPLWAIQATQTLGFILAALSLALWARHLFRKTAAVWLAVAAYTFAPFHLVNVYVRGDSLSEFWAFVWYPLILWALEQVAERPTFSRLLAASLPYGALILTHNVSALIFSPFALLYALTLAARSPRRTWARYGLPFAVGIALTAWFWYPALSETAWGQMGADFTAGYFHYSHHFRRLDLVQRSFFFDYRVAATENEAGPFAMGLAQAGLTVLGLGMVLRSWGRRRAFVAGAFLLATVMITPLSRPLWEHLHLLAMTQFPWRFLSVQALFAAAAIGVLADAVPLRSWGAWGLVALLAGASLGNLHPDRLAITDADITWDTLRFYESFSGNIGTTIRYEYLPRDVVPRLYISEAVLDGQGRLIADGVPVSGTLRRRTATAQVWQVTLLQPAPVTFPLNWWPDWHAQVDQQPAPTSAQTGSGRLVVSLPAGTHTVRLRLSREPLPTALLGLALLSLPLWGWLIWRARRRAVPWGIALGVTGLLALLAAAPRPQPAWGAMRTFDFDQMPYPHGGTVAFEGVELLDAAPPSLSVRPGETVAITTTWRVATASPLRFTLELVSPATPRHGLPLSFAVTTDGVPCSVGQSCSVVSHLALPPDLSRGLYLLQLRLYAAQDELRAHTPQGRGLGMVYLGIVRVSHGPQVTAATPILAQFSDLTLHEVTTTRDEAGQLSVKLLWSLRHAGVPRNWSLSVRLLDAGGRVIVQQDGQPGYGYLPTTLWLPGELVRDDWVLPLPAGLAPGRYTLRVIPYLKATMAADGQADVPLILRSPTLYDLRTAGCEQARKGKTILCETDGVALLDTDTPTAITQGQPLDFHADWNALRAPTVDVTATWQLVSPTGQRVAETGGPLAVGSQTSTWPKLTWVQSPVHLTPPPDLPPGAYRVRVVLHGSTVVTCTLPPTLTIRDRPRSFALPHPTHPQEATFGDEIRLLGYDLAQDESLHLTLWWQAARTPTHDYKRFVHLYDPATERIAAQDDAMPRAWQYPTTWWQAGEVVSETLTLPLAGVAAGNYRLGVGWYDPQTGERLTTTAPDGRLTLDTPIPVR